MHISSNTERTASLWKHVCFILWLCPWHAFLTMLNMYIVCNMYYKITYSFADWTVAQWENSLIHTDDRQVILLLHGHHERPAWGSTTASGSEMAQNLQRCTWVKVALDSSCAWSTCKSSCREVAVWLQAWGHLCQVLCQEFTDGSQCFGWCIGRLGCHCPKLH